MQIHVHTDQATNSHAAAIKDIERVVVAGLSRFTDRLTRVDVHLSNDQPGASTGATTRCLIEARPRGATPMVVTHRARTPIGSVKGGVRRLNTVLGARLGRAARIDDAAHRHMGN
jgi:hypothetical protein